MRSANKPTKDTKEKSIQYYLNAIRNSNKKIQKETQRVNSFRDVLKERELKNIVLSARQFPYRIFLSDGYDIELMYLYNIKGVGYVDAVYIRNKRVNVGNFYLPDLEQSTKIITKEEFEKTFNNISNKLKILCGLLTSAQR